MTLLWNKLIYYINSKNINEIIERKKIIKILELTPTSQNTFDTYRMVLCQIGVLEVVKRGQYKKVKNIPKTLTISKARKLAYDEPHWKQWFIPLEMYDELSNK